MADRLPLLLDLGVKAAVLVLSLYPLVDPNASHFAGKAMGARAVMYPAFTLLIPAIWFFSGRPSPYPFVADIALGIPFAVDAAGNVFGLFAITGFDAIPHATGWFFLSMAFGLGIAPLVEQRWEAFGLVLGFGATIDILWELGEFLLMKSGASGLQLTYENTIQDLTLSLLGAAIAAVVIATLLWPRPGTPRAPFGWQVPPGEQR